MYILIADDDPVIVEILTAEFKKSGAEIVVTHTSEDAINICKTEIFDAYIIDMLMPEGREGHILSYLANLRWVPLVMVMTGYANISAKNVYNNNVQAFIRKPFRPVDMVHSIKFHWAERGKISIGRILTDRELEILVLISTGKSSKEIGNQLSLSIRTIEKHRENILNKLGAKNTAQLISKTYRQIG